MPDQSYQGGQVSQTNQTYQQPDAQQSYQQTQLYGQNVQFVVEQPQPGAARYPMTPTDQTLRVIAFVFMILSLIATCWLILPLAWMIPMTVITWKIYKGEKANTVAFGVCTLIFASLIAGILLLCSHKDVKLS